MSLNGLAGAHRKKTNMAAARFGNVFTVLMFVIVNQIMIQRSVPTAPLQHPFCPGFQSVKYLPTILRISFTVTSRHSFTQVEK